MIKFKLWQHNIAVTASVEEILQELEKQNLTPCTMTEAIEFIKTHLEAESKDFIDNIVKKGLAINALGTTMVENNKKWFARVFYAFMFAKIELCIIDDTRFTGAAYWLVKEKEI